MDVYEMAKHYYQDYTPPLWNESRLRALEKAGKLTPEQVTEILSGGGAIRTSVKADGGDCHGE